MNSKHLYLEGVHWKKGELLGTGAYSSCYAVRDLMNGSLMAVKQVWRVQKLSPDMKFWNVFFMDKLFSTGIFQVPFMFADVVHFTVIINLSKHHTFQTPQLK